VEGIHGKEEGEGWVKSIHGKEEREGGGGYKGEKRGEENTAYIMGHHRQ